MTLLVVAEYARDLRLHQKALREQGFSDIILATKRHHLHGVRPEHILVIGKPADMSWEEVDAEVVFLARNGSTIISIDGDGKVLQ